VPLVGSVPLDAALASGGDVGEPVAFDDTAASGVFATMAERVVTEISPPVEMSSWQRRLVERIEEALGP